MFSFNVLACSTEPNNNDYDNYGSDNYDYNFDTFDNVGVKITNKYTHNMILMSKYKGTVTWWKKGQQIWARTSPTARFEFTLKMRLSRI